MPVVSNTSPVLNLAIIDQLVLLREQFGEIWIPPAVLKELRPKAGFHIGAGLFADLVKKGEETKR